MRSLLISRLNPPFQDGLNGIQHVIPRENDQMSFEHPLVLIIETDRKIYRLSRPPSLEFPLAETEYEFGALKRSLQDQEANR